MQSFAYISTSALLCYLFLFVTFIMARRTRLINAFLGVVAALMLWVGGSLFMRLQLWPSYRLWYHVSIVGLLLVLVTTNRFIRVFSEKLRTLWDHVLDVGVALLLVVNILTDKLLAAPRILSLPGGEVRFEYHPTWWVLFLYAAAVYGVGKIVVGIVRYGLHNVEQRRQLMPLVVGLVGLLVGNAIIMLPPLAGIPLDIVAGVFNACCLIYMLYQRRMFKLTLLVSRRSCYFAMAMVVFVLFANILTPFERFIGRNFKPFADYTMLIVALAYTCVTLAFSSVFKALIDRIFIREEKSQAKLLEEFSAQVAKSLRMSEILEQLIWVVNSALGLAWAGVSTLSPEKNVYLISHCSDPLDKNASLFRANNPIAEWFETHDDIMVLQAFCKSVEYRSMWEEEKRRLEALKIKYIVPLREGGELMGLLLLASKEKNKKFTYSDEGFLTSVKAVASIAVKNAILYEKVYYDARTDDLTGLLNRKYFIPSWKMPLAPARCQPLR